MASVGKHIKHLRTARNMTQEQLAERLFVTRQAVSAWERRKRPCRMWTPWRASHQSWMRR